MNQLSSQGLHNGVTKGSWALNFGNWRSKPSIPVGKCRLEHLVFSPASLPIKDNIVSSSSWTISSFINDSFTPVTAKSWSLLENEVVVSMEIKGDVICGEGESEQVLVLVFIISSSIAALCSNTFNDVAFLYILHNTMSCNCKSKHHYCVLWQYERV